MIPLMVDFTGKKVIIFGGGVVGARKARYFANEAEVVVYSRSFHPEFREIPVRMETCNLTGDEDILRTMVSDASLAIAATSDPRLNEQIKSACTLEHVWCNVAAGKKGDVVLPAKISGTRYVIAVSTTGSVPAVSRLIREELEDSFPDLDDLVLLGEWIRDTYRGERTGPDSYEKVLYTALRDPDMRKALASGMKDAREYIQRKFAI
jgi:precorrin-2 dehydrogenase/sirohydrochlorin ferrochelatase